MISPDRFTRAQLAEALDALAVRARWYETRGYNVPARTLDALRAIAAALGVDPTTVGRPKS